MGNYIIAHLQYTIIVFKYQKNKSNVVIIELKQWDKATEVGKALFFNVEAK